MTYSFFKRCFDIFSALILLILISPLFLALMVISIFTIGFPVFFVQERSGKNMKTISVLKFRSMTNKTDSNGKLLPDKDRITKYGAFLRSTSLDELPQLLNVIVGNMSVIGPRPLPLEYDAYYTKTELSRFKVKSGLIQPEVLYDKTLPTWDEQLSWEAEYAEKLNFKTDLKILLKAFKIVFRRAKDNYGNKIRPSLIEERGEKQ